MKKKLIFIVGPTAAGKSKLAFLLAKKIKGEIISADSMQVYKGMDILTAKPSKIIRKEIHHHLIDIVSAEKDFSAADFRRRALGAIKKIHNKKKIPIIVGGTGLYVRSLISGLFEAPKADLKIRRQLEKLALKRGTSYLYNKLSEVDPKAAGKIHPNDLRRIIRALEVYQKAGQPITKLQAKTKGLGDRYEIKIFILNIPRGRLYQKINKRVEEMFEQEAVEEVRKLLSLKLSKSAQQALGIKEIKGCLEGNYSLDEAKRLLQRNTRHYAKRQLTWFRKMAGVRWVDNLSATFLAKQCLK
jgi:tRNA dimethylallyltransferase